MNKLKLILIVFCFGFSTHKYYVSTSLFNFTDSNSLQITVRLFKDDFKDAFKKKYLVKPGSISGLFLIFYSLFRFFAEFFRSPDPQIGYLILNLTLGQLISILFLVSGALLFYLKK